ncbi:alcohol dehydrogenase catalytic domain-containing protein [Candidatus Aerophobetes bacterium]|nr:alcohol dehydrogenase catalytic domain-containing protein [Candidatus Aerophobetes bacterium]
MKAIMKIKKEREGFELCDVPMPCAGDRDILIKVRSAAICGSDLKFCKWTAWCDNVVKFLPFIPGHELCGEVVEVGKKVKGIKVGDRIAAETHISCGVCWQCRHARPHTCERMELFGHTINGGFCEYTLIPERAARKISNDIPFDYGCLLEPMGIPFRAVEVGEVAKDAVVVVGCGPIGQFAVAFSKISGAEVVIAVDINDKRLNLAKKMGANYLINPQREAVAQKVKNLTTEYGRGAGLVIDASGSAGAMKDAFSYLRPGGKFVILGQTDAPLPLNPSLDIVFKEAQVTGLFGRKIWDTWEKTEKLLLAGKIDPAPVITHRFSLDDFEKAFKVALSGEGCKILFIP